MPDLVAVFYFTYGSQCLSYSDFPTTMLISKTEINFPKWMTITIICIFEKIVIYLLVMVGLKTFVFGIYVKKLNLKKWLTTNNFF